MQMPFEIQLDLAAVVESPRTYYTEPSEPEGGWTMFFQVFVIWHCLRDPPKKGQHALHVYSIANFETS